MPPPPVIPSTRGGTAPPPSATCLRCAIPSTTSRVRRLLVAGIPQSTTASLHLRHPSPLILCVSSAVASDSGTSSSASASAGEFSSKRISFPVS